MGRRGPEVVFSFFGGQRRQQKLELRRLTTQFSDLWHRVRVGEPSKTRWGTRTRELVSSATGIGWHVCRLETGNATSVLGDGSVLGGGNRGSSTWETRDHQKPRPVKLAPATFLAGAQVLSLPCNPALRTGRIWDAIPGP